MKDGRGRTISDGGDTPVDYIRLFCELLPQVEAKIPMGAGTLEDVLEVIDCTEVDSFGWDELVEAMRKFLAPDPADIVKELADYADSHMHNQTFVPQDLLNRARRYRDSVAP